MPLSELHVNTLELEVRVTVVGARRVNAVLVADHFPELRADLVAALATLRGMVPKAPQKLLPRSIADNVISIQFKSARDACAAIQPDPP